MQIEKIQVRSFAVRNPAAGRGGLLFVHGGYVDGACWEVNFFPFFSRQGYDCHAVDLSGHGGSEGRERLDEIGIGDYAADVAQAVAMIGRPLTLVGHSMGARVVEHYLEAGGEEEAAIFLAPVPVTGMAGSALQLALRHPGFFGALEAAVRGDISKETADLMTRIYFAPGVRPHETLQYLPMLCPESQRAIVEMALPKAPLSWRRRRLPALVVGGECDAVFPASLLHFMGIAWNAEVRRICGAGHMLMLDPQWQNVAEEMLAWLNKVRPQ